MVALKPIDDTLVTVGQPTEGGCVYTSFAENPTLPTDAVTKVSTLSNLESLGDISENGFTEAKSVSSTKHKNWNGDTVASSTTEKTTTYKLEFLETSRPAVAKLRYGSKSVKVDEASGSVSQIDDTGEDSPVVPLVIDELESNGWLRRTVIPRAVVESMDDVPHQKGSLLVYGMTFTVLKSDKPLISIYRAKAPASA